MNALTDPAYYVTLLGALVPALSGLGVVYLRLKHRRTHFEQVERLLALLPDKDIDHPNAPLKQRYLWTEALQQLDLLTLPRPRPVRAILFTVAGAGGVIITFSAVSLVVLSNQSVPDRVFAAMVSLVSATWAGVAFLVANDYSQPCYHLAGRALHEYSPHVHRIRDLRADYGLHSSLDSAAEKIRRRRIGRARRARRWHSKLRYHLRMVLLISGSPLARRARRSFRPP